MIDNGWFISRKITRYEETYFGLKLNCHNFAKIMAEISGYIPGEHHISINYNAGNFNVEADSVDKLLHMMLLNDELLNTKNMYCIIKSKDDDVKYNIELFISDMGTSLRMSSFDQEWLVTTPVKISRLLSMYKNTTYYWKIPVIFLTALITYSLMYMVSTLIPGVTGIIMTVLSSAVFIVVPSLLLNNYRFNRYFSYNQLQFNDIKKYQVQQKNIAE